MMQSATKDKWKTAHPTPPSQNKKSASPKGKTLSK